MRRIELARFLAGVRGEHSYQVFIDESENVIVLASIHRNVTDKLKECLDGPCLRSGAIAQLAQARLKRDENLVEHLLVGWCDKTRKRRKRVTHVRNVKIVSHTQPSGEQILMGNEIAKSCMKIVYDFSICLVELRLDFLGRDTISLGELLFSIGQKLVEDET